MVKKMINCWLFRYCKKHVNVATIRYGGGIIIVTVLDLGFTGCGYYCLFFIYLHEAKRLPVTVIIGLACLRRHVGKSIHCNGSM